MCHKRGAGASGRKPERVQVERPNVCEGGSGHDVVDPTSRDGSCDRDHQAETRAISSSAATRLMAKTFEITPRLETQ